jgi:hypothetical protein
LKYLMIASQVRQLLTLIGCLDNAVFYRVAEEAAPSRRMERDE